MAVPRILLEAWAWWTPIAHAIGVFQTKVILSLLYVVLLGPLSPIFFFKDALGLRRHARWTNFETRATDLATAKRQ